jgi:hypothetical protein
MSIKFIDSLEPNGKFKLVDAKHIAYTSNVASARDSVDSIIHLLEDTVFATPKIYIQEDYLETSFELGETITIPMQLEATASAVGNCTITVTSKAGSSTGGFGDSRSFLKPAGSLDLELGKANTINNVLYKIVAVDGANKPFDYYSYSYYDPATKEYKDLKKLDTLIIRVISGLCSFSSSFRSIASTTTYKAYTEEELSIDLTHTYANPCAKKEFICSLYKQINTIVNGTPTTELQAVTGSSQTFTVPNSEPITENSIAAAAYTRQTLKYNLKTEEASTYVLKVEAKTYIWSDSEGGVQLDEEANARLEFTLDVMEPNSIVLTDQTEYLNNLHRFDANDYVKLVLWPKASEYDDRADRAINLTGDLILTAIYKTESDDEAYNKFDDGSILNEQGQVLKSIKAWITHGQAFNVDLGKLAVPRVTTDYIMQFNAVFKATGQRGSSKQDFVISFSVKNSQLTSKNYSQDDLQIYFPFDSLDEADMQEYLTTSTLSNKAPDTSLLPNYKLKFNNALDFDTTFPVTTIETSVGSGENQQTFSESFNALNLGGVSYAYTEHNNSASNPWRDLVNQTSSNSVTFETRFKSSCNGLLDSIAWAIGATPDMGVNLSSGIYGSYNSAKINMGENISCELQDDTWHHVCITCSDHIPNNFNEGEQNLDDPGKFASMATLRIYVDGVLCKIKSHQTSYPKGTFETSYPLMLNGIASWQNSILTATRQGNLEMQFIRMYSRVLSADEVYANYCSSVGAEYNKYLMDQTSPAHMPVIYAVRNKADRISKATTDYWTKKGLSNIPFSQLNEITKKKPVGPDDKDNTSKTCLTNCTIYWRDENGGTIATIGDSEVNCKYMADVDIHLQGTSSLKYPVKNYQFKFFQDVEGSRKKYPILPPYAQSGTDWPSTSYIYTLKCDYMEQSHRNNTPTASYYEEVVLPAVLEYCQAGKVTPDYLYNKAVAASPARRARDVQSGQPKYRDAINGFPCILYYVDLPEDATFDYNKPALSGAGVTYAGTYMFNVDKEGDQLGFNIPLSEITDLSDPNSTAPAQELYVNLNGRILERTEDGIEKVTSETGIAIEHYPCISYEGTTNVNYSAAAFVPFKEQRVLYLRSIFNDEPEIAEPITNDPEKRRIYYRQLNSDKSAYALNEDQEFIKDVNSYEDLTYEEFLSKIDEINQAEEDNLPLEQSKYFFNILSPSEHGQIYGKTEYEYIQKTLEPRWSFVEENLPEDWSDLDDAAKTHATYDTIKQAIDWIYYATENLEKITDETALTEAKEEFKKEFSKYFSFEYCLAYYLQLLVFTQVDNAGKNAMFDTWGDGRIYPRPYDMDTQMGLDNTGTDNIPESAEVHYDLSPQTYRGGALKISNWEAGSNPKHRRFSSYNTSRSYLWKTFGTYFDKEIAACYAYLRNEQNGGVYSLNRIQSFINAKTADVISGQFYNHDAALKYLNIKAAGNYTDSWYYCVNGSRKDRYYNFLERRLCFLDSLLKNEQSEHGRLIQIRAENSSVKSANLVVRPYSPQYIQVTTDQGETLVAYIDETTTYSPSAFTKQPGARISIPIEGNNKNIDIERTPGNLHTIDGIQNMGATHLQISDAIKLTSLQIANTLIQELSLGTKKYLTELDLHGMENLSGTLDLSACHGLEKLDISNTQVNGLILPGSGGSTSNYCTLKFLNCSNTPLKSLELNNCLALTNDNLILTNCSLIDLTLINCPLLINNFTQAEQDSWSSPENWTLDDHKKRDQQYFSFKAIPTLQNITLGGSTGFKVVDVSNRSTNYLLNSLTLYNDLCTKVICTNSMGNAFNNLNLASLPKLTEVKLNNVMAASGSGGSLVLPAFNSDSNISFTLNVANSNISTIRQHGAADEIGTFNFDFTDHLSSFTLAMSNNKDVKKVSNLKYTKSLNSLFNNCTNLHTINNCKFMPDSGYNSANYMFSGCTNLKYIEANDYNFSAINSAEGLAQNCDNLSWDSIYEIMAALHTTNQSRPLNLSYLFYNCTISGNLPSTIKVPATITALTDEEICFFPSNTNKLYNAFANTSLTKVMPGSFENLTLLETAERCFYYCTNLRYVPYDLFYNCGNLKVAKATFTGCYNLGTLSNQDDSPCIFTSQTKVFNSTQLENIASLFQDCRNLTRPTTISDTSKATLQAFFAGLSGLKIAAGVFTECSKLDFDFEPNAGIFSDCERLTTVSGMFAKTKLSTLPMNIFRSQLGDGTTQNFPYLTLASGLFANCLSINRANSYDTVIDAEFFTGARKLQDLGRLGDGNGLYSYYPSDEVGMFANLNISFDIKALEVLTSLTDTSGLFFVGKEDGGGSPSRSEPATGTNKKIFGVRFVQKDQDSYTPISDPINIFPDAPKLTNIQYMFAGIQKDFKIPENFFSNVPNITKMIGTFCGSTGLKLQKIGNLFKDLKVLTHTSLMFANCPNVTSALANEGISILAPCQSLIYCTGMFANSGISGKVPASLFNGCRDTLVDISHMFAGCKGLTGIECGKAIINDPFKFCKNDAVDAIWNTLDNELMLTQDFANITEFKNALLTSPLNDRIVEIKHNWFGQELDSNASFDRYENYVWNMWHNCSWEDKATNCYLGEVQITSLSELIQSIRTKAPDDTIELSRKANDEVIERLSIQSKVDFYIYNKDVEIVQPGLLSNCPRLYALQALFAGCSNLQGAIPADMFYYSEGEPSTSLTSIAELFKGCHTLSCLCYASLQADNKHCVKPINQSNSCFGTCSGYNPATADSDRFISIDLPRGGNYYAVYPNIIPRGNNQNHTNLIINDFGQTCLPNYFVPADWLSALTKLQNIDYVFAGTGILCSETGLPISTNPNMYGGSYYGGTWSEVEINYGRYYEALILPDTLFAAQEEIASAKSAFCYCFSISGSRLTNVFLQNSLYRLRDITSIFEASLLSGTENMFTVSRGVNTVLQIATKAFKHLNTDMYSSNNTQFTNGYLLGSENGNVKAIVQFDVTGNKNNLPWSALESVEAPPFFNYSKFTNCGEYLSSLAAHVFTDDISSTSANRSRYLQDYELNSTSNWGKPPHVSSITWDTLVEEVKKNN